MTIDAAANYKRALDEYYKAGANAPRAEGRLIGTSDPDPMTVDELNALDELDQATNELKAARQAWIATGRPPL